MATAPEHYREAERLATAVVTTELPFGHLRSEETLALAQVHATLALAAALLYPTPGQVAAASMASGVVNNVNHGGGFGIQTGHIDGGVVFPR